MIRAVFSGESTTILVDCPICHAPAVVRGPFGGPLYSWIDCTKGCPARYVAVDPGFCKKHFPEYR